MALTKQDKMDIAEIVAEVKTTNGERQKELIETIKEQVETNTKIFVQISEIGDHIGNVATSLNNGISQQITDTAAKVDSIEFEVNNKKGTLNKLYTKMNYF
jgi:hypothetical protein